MREVVFQPKIWVHLPKELKVKSWRVRVKGDRLTIDFEIPNLFTGTIDAEIYWEKDEAFIETMYISGRYLYESNQDYKWNHFEFEEVKEYEAGAIWAEIISGDLLIKEMDYRREPIDPEFSDHYGPEVVADIKNAINKLFPGLLQTG